MTSIIKVVVSAIAVFYGTYSAADVRYSSCSSEEIAKIRPVVDAVLEKIDELANPSLGVQRFTFEWIQKEFAEKENRELKVEPDQPEKVEAAYKLYHDELVRAFSETLKFSLEGFKIKCKGSFERRCRKNKDKVAYVLLRRNVRNQTINLCPKYFETSERNAKRTILHELTHLSVDSDDAERLEPFSLEKLKRLSKDAYHLETFADQDSLRALRGEVLLNLYRRKSSI